MIRLFYILLLCLPILSDTKFYVLGTGTPNPNPDRAGSAYLLVVNDEPYLFDFGANVINGLIPFILLPILTRYLTVEAYGQVAIFQTLYWAVSAFVGLSLIHI
mgnify:CR=1 FL=1